MKMDDDLRTTFWSCLPSPALCTGVGLGASWALGMSWPYLAFMAGVLWATDVLARAFDRTHQQERRDQAEQIGIEKGYQSAYDDDLEACLDP